MSSTSTAASIILENVTSVLTSTSTSSSSTTPRATMHYGSGLKFREDGLRETPLFMESSNLIIMIVGLSILVVPIAGFLVWICARTKFFHSIRVLKLTSSNSDTSGLPYSHFDQDTEDLPNSSSRKSKTPVSKDVRVLLNNDNVVTGSPSKNQNAVLKAPDHQKAIVAGDTTSSTSMVVEDLEGADATFVTDSSRSHIVQFS